MSGAGPGLHTPTTLSEAALAVLLEPSAVGKVERTRAYAAAWCDRRMTGIGRARPPDRPARPPRPELRPPRDMPKRRTGGAAGRAAFVHAIAHIELNAIDLAWDIVVRFTGEALPEAFYDDWVGVALDEAEHFAMLSDRLADLGSAYGDLPAHDGLWQATTDTADDLLARLAVVPMILEARGLELNGRLEVADGKPLTDGVVLMVHGTLAHNGMETIRGLQEVLAEREINSLAITLSLGVSDRKGMYDCAKTHRHRHTDALDEIELWFDWLNSPLTKLVLADFVRL